MTAELFELLLERREITLRRSFGMQMAVTANSAFGRGENCKTFSPLDFYPDQKQEETTTQTPEQQATILKAFFSRFKKKK